MLQAIISPCACPLVRTAAGPSLRLDGLDAPALTYEALSERLGLGELIKNSLFPLKKRYGKEQRAAQEKRRRKAAAFSRTVLEFLFRDINDGGCPGNWEVRGKVSTVWPVVLLPQVPLPLPLPSALLPLPLPLPLTLSPPLHLMHRTRLPRS